MRHPTPRTPTLVSLLASLGIASEAEGPASVRVAPGSADTAARDVARINAMMVERGLAVSGIHVAEPSLEDIFVAATGAPPSAGSPTLKLAA